MTKLFMIIVIQKLLVIFKKPISKNWVNFWQQDFQFLTHLNPIVEHWNKFTEIINESIVTFVPLSKRTCQKNICLYIWLDYTRSSDPHIINLNGSNKHYLKQKYLTLKTRFKSSIKNYRTS